MGGCLVINPLKSERAFYYFVMPVSIMYKIHSICNPPEGGFSVFMFWGKFREQILHDRHFHVERVPTNKKDKI